MLVVNVCERAGVRPFVANTGVEVLKSFTDFQFGKLCLFAGASGSLKTSCIVQAAVDLLKKSCYTVLYFDVMQKIEKSPSFRLLASLNDEQRGRFIVFNGEQDWHNLSWLIELVNSDSSVRMIVVDSVTDVFGIPVNKNLTRDLSVLSNRLRLICLSKNILCFFTTYVYNKRDEVLPLGGVGFSRNMDFVCCFKKCSSSVNKSYKSIVNVNGAFEFDVVVNQETGGIFSSAFLEKDI